MLDAVDHLSLMFERRSGGFPTFHLGHVLGFADAVSGSSEFGCETHTCLKFEHMVVFGRFGNLLGMINHGNRLLNIFVDKVHVGQVLFLRQKLSNFRICGRLRVGNPELTRVNLRLPPHILRRIKPLVSKHNKFLSQKLFGIRNVFTIGQGSVVSNLSSLQQHLLSNSRRPDGNTSLVNILDVFPQLDEIILQFGFEVHIIMQITRNHAFSIVTAEQCITIRHNLHSVGVLAILDSNSRLIIFVMDSHRGLLYIVLSLSESISADHI